MGGVFSRPAWGVGARRDAEARRLQRFPDYAALEEGAKRRLPRFAFDFVQAGSGAGRCLARNRAVLDAIELIPRYGGPTDSSSRISLMGRDYSSPVGIAPVGMDGLVWPRASLLLAKAAAAHDVPYITGALAAVSLEAVAEAGNGNV